MLFGCEQTQYLKKFTKKLIFCIRMHRNTFINEQTELYSSKQRRLHKLKHYLNKYTHLSTSFRLLKYEKKTNPQ